MADQENENQEQVAGEQQQEEYPQEHEVQEEQHQEPQYQEHPQEEPPQESNQMMPNEPNHYDYSSGVNYNYTSNQISYDSVKIIFNQFSTLCLFQNL